MSKTLYDKLWDEHQVVTNEDGSCLIYIDRHLLHEVTSPQAFAGLELNQRQPWRVEANLAVCDHNVPTKNLILGIQDKIAAKQISTLHNNCQKYGITEFQLGDIRQGIVHVIGPEQGAVLPGMTVVCGDSHTSTHGALGALAFGIGTSEIEHVLATQCLVQKKSKNMRININGTLGFGVGAKDVILHIIGKIGTAGGTGYTIEFAGEVIRNMSIEGRMTVCNMTIEAGARAGIIAVDDKTIDYVKGRPFSPKGDQWQDAVSYWHSLHSDTDAKFDLEININATDIEPQVSWGTSPEMTTGINGTVPKFEDFTDENNKQNLQKSLEYMGLKPGQKITDINIDRVFIGSCTNSRIEDLQAAANIIQGAKLANNIKEAIVVPGSGLVKQQAEQLGLDKIFTQAGFEWRQPGCSMCLAMNDDKIEPGEHCASTSNRNFEGRQGSGSRTHLVSPIMATAAALAGHFVDVRNL